MAPGRAWMVGIVIVATVACGALTAAVPRARAAEPSVKLPCVFYNPDLGEYGAWVFRPLHAPSRCTEYVGNKPCHCTESPLTGVRWQRWGSRRAVGIGFWHYCGSGVCLYRRAHLLAYRPRATCGGPVYTRLRMRLPGRMLHGHPLRADRDVFHLSPCAGPFDYS